MHCCTYYLSRPKKIVINFFQHDNRLVFVTCSDTLFYLYLYSFNLLSIDAEMDLILNGRKKMK